MEEADQYNEVLKEVTEDLKASQKAGLVKMFAIGVLVGYVLANIISRIIW